MTRIVRFTIIVVLVAPTLFAAPPSGEAEKVWSQEKAYWEYVKANDLQKYRTLWHTDFLGWPSVSPERFCAGTRSRRASRLTCASIRATRAAST